MPIEQGQIFDHDFGPRKNHLQEGPRPVVVIQCNALNRIAGYPNVIVVPLTRTEKKSATYIGVAPSSANQLTSPSWAITNQIFTIDQGDLKSSLGHVSKEELYGIKQGLKIVLDI